MSATPGRYTRDTATAVAEWICFFSCSLPAEFGSIGCLQITGVRNAIGAVEVKSGDAGWGCWANNNGCGRRSRSRVRKAATKSYGG